MNEKSGIRRATDAAWVYLPQVIVAAVVALAVFVGGVWVDLRDLGSVVGHIEYEQAPTQVCKRISECSVCSVARDTANKNTQLVVSATNHIDSHNAESVEWKRRIIVLEQKIYDIKTKASARSDPATGTMLRSVESLLDRRLKALEGNKP